MAAAAVTTPRSKTMLVRIITSCTGEKKVSHEHQLTLADFQKGPEHVARREAELKDSLTPAVELYSGLQHVRLLRGIQAIQSDSSRNLDTDNWIVSAGYGLIPGNRAIPPYEATFIGMGSVERKQWARQLRLAESVGELLAQPADLIFVLLGDDYLEACDLNVNTEFGGPCFLFCGQRAAKRLPNSPKLHKIVLANSDAKVFSCGLVGLKGELTSRFLEALLAGRFTVQELEQASSPLKLLSQPPEPFSSKRAAARANHRVDKVIQIPSAWWQKPHREKLSYFIPEWDDLVDPDFDFEHDIHSGGSGDWSNETYAHQMYPEPNYDGILISKVVAEKSKRKKERINQLGVHRFLRVPREFPIMGDCGAFGYIQQKTPPYSTPEILDYYTRLDFDFGVSIDHLIVTATESEKHERYELTIENAAEFLREHRKLKLPWTPIGAVQGWDPDSYASAAKKYVAMGYQYIGLGGLVRSSTPNILHVLDGVHRVVPERVRIHLFGLARLAGLARFAQLGVSSVDSASFLRQAWMRTTTSFVMPEASYAALRIPEAGKSFRAKRMNVHAGLDDATILRLERAALEGVRAYSRHQAGIDLALNAVLEYDRLVTADRIDLSGPYRRTLEERPWEECDCPICKSVGAEVVIFRGNNRNRRRGFHNTYVFYRLLQRVLAGEVSSLLVEGADDGRQRSLFASGGAQEDGHAF